ncbi:MAG: L-seryl-tRNA(Sec) selenium transferase [Desulfobulbaceae bacterium]|nr:L-seryl-tRNA(Sec) selenium transferase [Desulfobulbaceae bacterium]
MAHKSREKASRGKESLRDLPSVEKLLQTPQLAKLVAAWSQPLVADYVREVIDSSRKDVSRGKSVPTVEEIVTRVKNELDGYTRHFLNRVINGTGIIIHTNLGRSPLGEEVLSHMSEIACGYSNLEYDLELGKRGKRGTHIYELLNKLVGCEASLAVNNNAAAVFLILSTLAKKREVIVSRGELVQIGGGFRIPEIMKSSGAKLIEVGTTNKTSIEDYRKHVGGKTALLLKVHQSNFQMEGFVESASVKELASLSKETGVPLVVDLGSGVLLNTEEFGFEHEPTPQEIIRSGADVVSFSGDKLLGGPQAGIILGRREIIDRIKSNPMTRALRIDKFTLAGLEAVLRLYYDEEVALAKIPTLAMLSVPKELLAARARRLSRRIKKALAGSCRVTMLKTDSRVGGGAMPEQDLPTTAVALQPENISVNELEELLRKGEVPVIGRIENDLFLLDMRTVADREIVPLADLILQVFGAV